jgi:methionine-rich copper-binding protein CopC
MASIPRWAWGSSRRSGVVLALGLVALVGAVGAPRPAGGGHGGPVQLSRVSAGAYTVSVWSQPSPPRPGPWQVDVAVMKEGGAPVGDAVVRVRAQPLTGSGQAVEADARREADPLGVRYRANLALGAAGAWRVTVSVTGTAGAGALEFPIEVEPGGGGWWPAFALSAAAVAVVAAIVLSRRRRLASLASVLMLVATPAWPHASLVGSSPARRATLTTAPDRVQLWFNEPIEPRFSSVSVWDAAGQQVDLRDGRVDPEDAKRLTVGLTPLKPGAYRVRFRVLSVDGHVVETEFSFTLR